MSNRRHSSSFAARRKRRKSLQNKEQQRKLLLERLERRELLAVGPQLIGIQPNNDSLLRFDRTDIRNVAPQELVFKFDENHVGCLEWSSVCNCRFGNLGLFCEHRQIKKRA